MLNQIEGFLNGYFVGLNVSYGMDFHGGPWEPEVVGRVRHQRKPTSRGLVMVGSALFLYDLSISTENPYFFMLQCLTVFPLHPPYKEHHNGSTNFFIVILLGWLILLNQNYVVAINFGMCKIYCYLTTIRDSCMIIKYGYLERYRFRFAS